MEDVKCYLYYNGEMIRFFPDQIRALFPTMFNMKYEGNKSFLEDKKNEELDTFIKHMKEILIDKSFEQFMTTFE